MSDPVEERARTILRIGAQMVGRLERLEEIDRITPSELKMTIDLGGVRFAVKATVSRRPARG